MTEELSEHIFEHEDAAGRLRNVLDSGGPQGLDLARRHLRGRGTPFSMAHAELAYAREMGFADWPALRVHVFRMTHDDAEDPLVRASEAVLARDAVALDGLVRAHPEILGGRPREGLDPLLTQAVGAREVACVFRLLELGADLQATAQCGCTAVHRAGYGHPPESNPGAQEDHAWILNALLAAGARTDVSSHGDGGTPLAMALFFGHAPLADLLSRSGIAPDNLRTAAGLGRVDRIEGFFDRDRRLLPSAGRHRSFYRPHDGFPKWRPSKGEQEILDEALLWAAKSGRLSAMEALLQRGASLGAATYPGSALSVVAHSGPVASLRWLLEHGASTESRSSVPSGSTPLHAAAWSGSLESTRLLLAHGADPEVLDEEFGSTPAGYARAAGNLDVLALLEGSD